MNERIPRNVKKLDKTPDRLTGERRAALGDIKKGDTIEIEDGTEWKVTNIDRDGMLHIMACDSIKGLSIF